MVIETTLSEPITAHQLKHVMDNVATRMDLYAGVDKLHSIVLDASQVSNYEREARVWFIKVWGPKNKHRVNKIAIVTKSPILRMAATTVGLVAGYKIDAFTTMEAARLWIARK